MKQNTSVVSISEPRAELRRLQAFVGSWSVEGTNGTSATTDPGARVRGVETFHWLEGNFFLVYEFNRTIGATVHCGKGFFGYDSETQKYFAQLFDNLGFAHRYDLKIRENRITLLGEQERAVLALNEAENRLIVHWEILQNGSWESLCDFEGTKTSAPKLSRVS